MAINLSVAVMVGNGFDLSAGLKTSTTRFIDFFSKNHASDDGPVRCQATETGINQLVEINRPFVAEVARSHNSRITEHSGALSSCKS